MKPTATLFLVIIISFFFSASCANNNQSQDSPVKPVSQEEPVYQLALSLNEEKQVGKWENGKADLSGLSLPFSFSWEGSVYEVHKASTIGWEKQSGTFNLYLSLEVFNRNTGDTLLYAAPLNLINRLNPKGSPLPCCQAYLHLCKPTKGAAQGFQRNSNACIIGCDCGKSPCDHSLSTGDLKGTDLISEISRHLIANSDSN